MAKLEWDKTGERFYETGVDHGVLYVYDSDNKAYGNGVAWNGLTAVNENPEGADLQEWWADNIKYASMRAAENYKATIEAYMYPDEFGICNGEASLVKGVTIGLQTRRNFCFAYRTSIGNDVDPEAGYKIHVIYNCTVAPSSKSHATVNDSPDAQSLSWEMSSVPVNVTGHKATSTFEVDSTKVTAAQLKKIEDQLFGTDTTDAAVLMPDELIALLK